MSEYGDMTLDEYRNSLSSKEPTPGGGTAAAIALSQAAALAVMVSKLTLGSEKWENGWDGANIASQIATPLLEKGHELALKDAHSFDGVMAAFKLPKRTDEENKVRQDAIQSGLLNAAMVPMQTAKHSYNLLQSLEELARTGNANAVTDVGVSALLTTAACKGALFNVEVNLISISAEICGSLQSEHDELKQKCREKAREIMHLVHERMHS